MDRRPSGRCQLWKVRRWSQYILFPTLSDGFGLTQLEAQRWKLPIIASGYCGDVVENGHNGIRLEGVTVDSICSALTDVPTFTHAPGGLCPAECYAPNDSAFRL
jgi:hypothetical protein